VGSGIGEFHRAGPTQGGDDGTGRGGLGRRCGGGRRRARLCVCVLMSVSLFSGVGLCIAQRFFLLSVPPFDNGADAISARRGEA
jgi:hypothetical protein